MRANIRASNYDGSSTKKQLDKRRRSIELLLSFAIGILSGIFLTVVSIYYSSKPSAAGIVISAARQLLSANDQQQQLLSRIGIPSKPYRPVSGSGKDTTRPLIRAPPIRHNNIPPPEQQSNNEDKEASNRFEKTALPNQATYTIQYAADKFDESKNYDSMKFKIPKVCYQSWMTKNMSTFQNKTQELHLSNRRTNPDIDFQLWDDQDVEEFMKKEYDGEIYDAFSSINSRYGAARGDFFRYCVLYRRGGLWLDFEASIRTTNFFGRVIREDDESVLDHRRIDLATYRRPWGYPTHENWFLAFMPKHPYLEYVIARLVRSIKRKVIPSGADRSLDVVLRITGPDAFTAGVHDAVVDVGVRHREMECDNMTLHWPIGPRPEYNTKKPHYATLKHIPFYNK